MHEQEVREAARPLIALALEEDLAEAGDVTSKAVFPPEHRSRAHITAKAKGVLCGLAVAEEVFGAVDGSIRCEREAEDGAALAPGNVVLRMEGPTVSLLAAERTALNFLQRLSGVASLTAEYVRAAAGRLAIVDTRKTIPGWRKLEKYAVTCGGGTNHRMGLFDMVMLKDTHADGAGGLEEALRRVKPLRPQLRVAAEARTMAEVQACLAAEVDLLMLDNIPAEELPEAIRRIGGAVPVEITGGVTLERVAELAALGVDRVSVGALTHSAPALDLSMRLELGAF